MKLYYHKVCPCQAPQKGAPPNSTRYMRAPPLRETDIERRVGLSRTSIPLELRLRFKRAAGASGGGPPTPARADGETRNHSAYPAALSGGTFKNQRQYQSRYGSRTDRLAFYFTTASRWFYPQVLDCLKLLYQKFLICQAL